MLTRWICSWVCGGARTVCHTGSVVEFVCGEILLDLQRCFAFCMVEVRCLVTEFRVVLCWRWDVVVPWWCYFNRCYVSRCCVSDRGSQTTRWLRSADVWSVAFLNVRWFGVVGYDMVLTKGVWCLCTSIG